jgi:hypothetical protein
MLRRFLSLGALALGLLVVMGAPGQVHAQRMRGGVPHGGHPGFHRPMMPGFRGGFMPGFRPAPMFGFDPRFRGGMFDRGFERRFDRFEDRFENRFNPGFFNPRFIPGFGPTFVRPF